MAIFQTQQVQQARLVKRQRQQHRARSAACQQLVVDQSQRKNGDRRQTHESLIVFHYFHSSLFCYLVNTCLYNHKPGSFETRTGWI
ncbi:uncharacterized protein LACBIDRAFT_304932 [Laccaria bicolor S238N-H82]|uniref:Predicted protein n=1 Tax=Laccaria bicolor (strain S238N-H82 / ATCC MYA-4686) TaxID=486041 RepID=B0DMP0_LACBS|nr:uncharacterized protein LACBIDRAFT_304932 [Laccaria bicolor S238N-H82]EDR04321.1 predicted protein [Laccaria bicolor S238N-H82]|eukprot:XP_001885212.1 predicted protein [Laccaria bicolor S238N-H82]